MLHSYHGYCVGVILENEDKTFDQIFNLVREHSIDISMNDLYTTFARLNKINVIESQGVNFKILRFPDPKMHQMDMPPQMRDTDEVDESEEEDEPRETVVKKDLDGLVQDDHNDPNKRDIESDIDATDKDTKLKPEKDAKASKDSKKKSEPKKSVKEDKGDITVPKSQVK